VPVCVSMCVCVCLCVCVYVCVCVCSYVCDMTFYDKLRIWYLFPPWLCTCRMSQHCFTRIHSYTWQPYDYVTACHYLWQ